MFARAHASHIEIPASDIELGRELQRGGMGAVHMGNWLGVAVAVKTITDPSKQEALLREADLLASLRHPCICQFFGATRIDGTLAMVMELLECSLHELIAQSSTRIPVALCLRLAHETAQGIAYLHRNNVLHRWERTIVRKYEATTLYLLTYFDASFLHRDIKPSNVVLDKLRHAKVCDFGLSKPYTLSKELLGDLSYLLESDAPNSTRSPTSSANSANSANSTYAVGTLRYMAPEVVQNTDEVVKIRYNAPSDVYSFGILLWALAHRETPFAGVDGVQVAIKVAPSGQRPPLQLPTGLEALGPLIASCWHRDPDQRPPMSVCAERLRALDC